MTIFTIGHGNRTLETFLQLLQAHGVQRVADVRSRPYSRWKHFCREALREALRSRGIQYTWLGRELGGLRGETGGATPQAYQAHMATEDFADGLAELEALARRAVTAVMCAEARPDRCHRQYISRALEQRGWTVLHIVNRGETWNRLSGPALTLDL